MKIISKMKYFFLSTLVMCATHAQAAQIDNPTELARQFGAFELAEKVGNNVDAASSHRIIASIIDASAFTLEAGFATILVAEGDHRANIIFRVAFNLVVASLVENVTHALSLDNLQSAEFDGLVRKYVHNILNFADPTVLHTDIKNLYDFVTTQAPVLTPLLNVAFRRPLRKITENQATIQALPIPALEVGGIFGKAIKKTSDLIN